MATLKVKFRESSVPGKPGTIFYQVRHEKKTIQIATRLHPFPEQWVSITEGPATSDIENKKNLTYIHRVIDADTALNRPVKNIPYTILPIDFAHHNVKRMFSHFSKNKSPFYP